MMPSFCSSCAQLSPAEPAHTAASRLSSSEGQIASNVQLLGVGQRIHDHTGLLGSYLHPTL